MSKKKSHLYVIANSKDEDQFRNINEQNFSGNNRIQQNMNKFNSLYQKL